MNNPRDDRIERIGFLKGAIEAIRLYAIWKNGEQFVGCERYPLKEALQPYKEELVRLEKFQIASDIEEDDE